MVAHLQDALAAAVADPDACTARCLARLAEEESSRAAVVARRSMLLCGGPSGQRGHPAQRLAGPGSAGERRGGRAAILAQARVTKSCSLPRRHHRGHSAQRPDLTTLIRLANEEVVRVAIVAGGGGVEVVLLAAAAHLHDMGLQYQVCTAPCAHGIVEHHKACGWTATTRGKSATVPNE